MFNISKEVSFILLSIEILHLNTLNSGSCRCCANIRFYHMRHHYRSHMKQFIKRYEDEHGVSSIIPNFQQ